MTVVSWFTGKSRTRRVLIVAVLAVLAAWFLPELFFQTATEAGPLPAIPMPAATVDFGCSLNGR
jgi:hypothetical protein